MSEILSSIVIHKTFGKGYVTEFNKDILTVIFNSSSEVKRFVYPDSFEKYLQFEDDELNKAAEKSLNEKNENKEKNRLIKGDHINSYYHNYPDLFITDDEKTSVEIAAKDLNNKVDKILSSYNFGNNIIFCNIAYMVFYDNSIKGDIPHYGGKYVEDNRDALEDNNFHVWPDNYVRGFVETKYHKGIPNDLHLEQINPLLNKENSSTGIDIVFCAYSEKKKSTVIIGWYKDATAFRHRQKIDDEVFYFITENYNAFLLPESERVFKIPRAKTNVVGMGQSNVWYANKSDAAELVERVKGYINEYKGRPLDPYSSEKR